MAAISNSRLYKTRISTAKDNQVYSIVIKQLFFNYITCLLYIQLLSLLYILEISDITVHSQKIGISVSRFQHQPLYFHFQLVVLCLLLLNQCTTSHL